MINLTIYPLSYADDLVPHYQSFKSFPGFVLLESGDKIRGRYDILSAYPYDQLKIARDDTDLSDAFFQLQSKLPLLHSDSDLPFQGGAIGYIAYDLGALLAGIKSPSHPLLDDMPIMDLRFYDWAIIADHQRKEVNLIAANRDPNTALFINKMRNLWFQPSRSHQPFTLLQPFTPLVSQDDYQHAFAAIHRDLQRGRAYQVNYTQPFLAQYQGDSWEMYKRVRRKNPVPFGAFLRLTEGEIVSFSPERFLLSDNGYLLTSPIKGSAKRSKNPVDDEKLQSVLQASSKNRAENIMIVDLLRNDLGKIAIPGTVKVKTLCELQSFNAVHHLVSDIEAESMPKLTPTEVFAACFPGGSITGAPKREAMRIISEHEPFARGVYCGSIAYFSVHGRFDSNIAIRTVIGREDSLMLAAGGGIVIDSNWEEEYSECYTKITAIVNQLK